MVTGVLSFPRFKLPQSGSESVDKRGEPLDPIRDCKLMDAQNGKNKERPSSPSQKCRT